MVLSTAMHYFSQFYPFAPGPMVTLLPLLILASLWTIVLKGFALWHAGRAGQKGWFIALLVINTFGILEVIYLVWFRPKPSPAPAPAISSSPQA